MQNSRMFTVHRNIGLVGSHKHSVFLVIISKKRNISDTEENRQIHSERGIFLYSINFSCHCCFMFDLNVLTTVTTVQEWHLHSGLVLQKVYRP